MNFKEAQTILYNEVCIITEHKGFRKLALSLNSEVKFNTVLEFLMSKLPDQRMCELEPAIDTIGFFVQHKIHKLLDKVPSSLQKRQISLLIGEELHDLKRQIALVEVSKLDLIVEILETQEDQSLSKRDIHYYSCMIAHDIAMTCTNYSERMNFIKRLIGSDDSDLKDYIQENEYLILNPYTRSTWFDRYLPIDVFNMFAPDTKIVIPCLEWYKP